MVIPADGRPAPPPLDPAAVPYFYVGAMVALWFLPFGGSVPVPFVAVGVAVCAAGGILAHRRTGDLVAKARAGLFLAAAVTTVLTLVHSTARSPLNADGNPNLSFNIGIILLSFIGGFYWDALGSWRSLMPATIACNTALAVALFPLAVDARSVIGAVVGGLYPFFPCRHLTSALGRVSAQHARSARAEDEELVRRSYVDGRESVVGLVRQARREALEQLERLGPRLDARLSELAARRIEEVERRLSTLDP